MAASVTILGTALPMKRARRLTQVPGTVGSQALLIGEHSMVSENSN